MKKYVLNGILFIFASVIFSFAYYEILGFSIAMPYPEFMESQINQDTALLHGIYHWIFVFITISVPFALISALTSYTLGRWLIWWLIPAAIVIGLFPFRAFAYTFWYWLSLVAVAIAVSYLTCRLAGYTRNKSSNTDGVNAAGS